MRRTALVIGTLALGVLVLSLAGCTRPLKEQVVGKWKHGQSPAQVEFLKDGTLICALGPVQATGKFTTPDEKHIRTELNGPVGNLLGSQTYTAEVKEKSLILTVGTEPLSFTRVE